MLMIILLTLLTIFKVIGWTIVGAALLCHVFKPKWIYEPHIPTVAEIEAANQRRAQKQLSKPERPLIEIAEDWVWDLNWKYKAGFLLLCGIAVAIAA